MLDLKEKLVLVTGSNAGIGYAIAKAFHHRGAVVIIHGRSEERVKGAQARLGGGSHRIVADLGSAEGCDALIKQAEALEKELGKPLDVIVHNMGIFQQIEFKDLSDEIWHQYFEVNVMSNVRVSRHFLGKMIDSGRDSRMIFISSETGLRPIPAMVQYSMTKTAQLSIARGMAEMTKGTKTTVNSVLPGPTWTEGVKGYLQGIADKKGENVEDTAAAYIRENEPNSLIQRFIEPEEIAHAVVFVAENSAVNGSALRVEGGIIRAL